MHDKSLGMAPGLATAQPLGNTKFANAPPLRLTRPANALHAVAGGAGVGLASAGISLYRGSPVLDFIHVQSNPALRTPA